MRRAVAVELAVVLLGALPCGRAIAEERRYALVIGYNGPPAGDATEAPPSLRFADDDALAFYELRLELGDEAILLASPDADSRRRYPQSADAARPPTLAAVDQAIAHLATEMRADTRAGRTSAFFFFYSGHGARDPDGQEALTLLDGPLSRRVLYERVLDRAPADVIHLFVDACHAEAVVRPRDGDARGVSLSADDVAAYVSQATLARYRQVGVAIASGEGATAHEWDLYQSGVFTHELISALRGAADVNGDGRIEYTELAAFLSAANREVQDPRARLQAIVKAPLSAPRAPIADLAGGRGTGRLTRIAAASESLYVEDATGVRLADGRPEVGFVMSLMLPANRHLFVRRGDEEAELVLQPGTDAPFGGLTFHPRSLVARGALESSLRAGLFLTPFGPAYYRGFVDREDAVAVPIAPSLGSITIEAPADQPARLPASFVRSSLAGAAAALFVSSGVFAGLSLSAWRDNQNAVERTSADAGARFQTDTRWAVGSLIAGVACAAGALLLDHRR